MPLIFKFCVLGALFANGLHIMKIMRRNAGLPAQGDRGLPIFTAPLILHQRN